MTKLGLVLAVSLLLASPASAARRQAPDETYARPGQMLKAADGAELNAYCMGRGSPTVILDAGWEDWSASWATLEPRIAKWTHVCAIDRPGMGFSGAGPFPRTTDRYADELKSALGRAGIGGPYILVGHAFGATNVRAFAYRYPSDVAGLVLFDPDVGDVATPGWRKRFEGLHERRAAEIVECRTALASGRALPKYAGGDFSWGSRPACNQQFFRGLPEKAWSDGLNGAVLKLTTTKLALYDAAASEAREIPTDQTTMRKERRSLGARPIRVVVAAKEYDHPAADAKAIARKQFQQEWRRMQTRLLSLSTNSRFIFAKHASSYVQLDEPDVAEAAVREVYDRVVRRPSR